MSADIYKDKYDKIGQSFEQLQQDLNKAKHWGRTFQMANKGSSSTDKKIQAVFEVKEAYISYREELRAAQLNSAKNLSVNDSAIKMKEETLRGKIEKVIEVSDKKNKLKLYERHGKVATAFEKFKRALDTIAPVSEVANTAKPRK